MDLLISISATRISVDLYDKRSEPAYATIPILRFPLWDDALPWQHKHTVVTSAIVRRARICNSAEAFVQQTTEILGDMISRGGYPPNRVLHRLRAALKKQAHLPFFPYLGDWVSLTDRVIASGIFRSPSRA
jgi:hypothetical protein